jgi:hypothetical protein
MGSEPKKSGMKTWKVDGVSNVAKVLTWGAWEPQKGGQRLKEHVTCKLRNH